MNTFEENIAYTIPLWMLPFLADGERRAQRDERRRVCDGIVNNP